MRGMLISRQSEDTEEGLVRMGVWFQSERFSLLFRSVCNPFETCAFPDARLTRREFEADSPLTTIAKLQAGLKLSS